ncbi:hypothetical protein E2C01_015165 [Portunus trituberculatus]|uniref:Uncharacterized protein n=1 Tax=Portunus trituberculatus TaxID=210409 RepID=A0A5B7DL42_PORTR|nr:hypothetical protein [Portunus trituberculatus]
MRLSQLLLPWPLSTPATRLTWHALLLPAANEHPLSVPLSNCRRQFCSPITVPRDLAQQEACGYVGHGVHSLT